MSSKTLFPILCLSLSLSASLSGCGTMSSSLVRTDDGIGHHVAAQSECLPDSDLWTSAPQFERGKPNVVIDSVGWVFGIPSRIALWNWGVENHNISIHTEDELRNYIADNGLCDVKVRLNQYDPGGEWRRLTKNKRVAPAWRYTFGALSTLGYTLVPGRLFGSDYYNPWTNTVNVYSDVPSLSRHPAGYAKDVHRRTYPGTYAFFQGIPGLNLVHETIATRDVLAYTAQTGNVYAQQEAIHVLYPRYGAAVGGAVDSFVPVGGLVEIGGLLVGHVSGRFKTRDLDDTEIALEAEPTASVTTVGYEEAAPVSHEATPIAFD